jgi:hypothetical protein
MSRPETKGVADMWEIEISDKQLLELIIARLRQTVELLATMGDEFRDGDEDALIAACELLVRYYQVPQRFGAQRRPVRLLLPRLPY